MITRRIARPLSAASSNWTCPNCTRASFLRQPRRQQQQQRTLLTLPKTSYDDSFKREGVPGLLSPDGYRIAWTQNQAMLVSRLNELIAGEPFENESPQQLAIKFARDPMSAGVFNYASMAHNNQFFFDGLSISPQTMDRVPSLQQALENTFGSIDTLRTTLLDTASSMFGPGFVWLVWTRASSDAGRSSISADAGYRILTTYAAGTPYPEAGYRQQGIDMATNNASSADAYYNSQPKNTVGSFGPHSKAGKESAKIPPGGTQLTPLLCVSTWEHVYIHDYGVTGKRRYLADWWKAIDWYRVQQKVPEQAAPRRFVSNEQQAQQMGAAGMR